MEVRYYLALCFVICGILPTSLLESIPTFSLTVAAKDRKVEVTFKNLPLLDGGTFILTSEEPKNCSYKASNIPSKLSCDNENVDVLYSFKPSPSSTYHKTNVTYKYTNAQEFNKSSSCHSVWAIYIDLNGIVVASTCLKVHPQWVNALLPNIGNKRWRDLIIPGTHDSGCYREVFEIPSIELPTTRYALTQDDTILGQLYQGARYLDIRPAYYKYLPYKWYVNHAITIQHPLELVMEQVVQFVNETGEPVIFGLKEFPIGFEDKQTHRDLVKFMVNYFGSRIVKPKGNNPWQSTLNELMVNMDERIILAYDDRSIVYEHSDILFPAVRQNWGNVRKWNELETYLKQVSQQDPLLVSFDKITNKQTIKFNFRRLSNDPVADMAELTATGLDVMLDKLGGLRKMADDVNLNLCDLYENELHPRANIIAVDFIKGTRVTEIAVLFNKLVSS